MLILIKNIVKGRACHQIKYEIQNCSLLSTKWELLWDLLQYKQLDNYLKYTA